MDALSPLVVEGLMLELIGETSRQSLRSSKADPPWLVQTRDILHQEFRHSLTLSTIAKSVGVHHTHLAREFRRHYRCTVGEYVRQLRVEFACRNLSTSDTPLSEIALAAVSSIKAISAERSRYKRAFPQPDTAPLFARANPVRANPVH